MSSLQALGFAIGVCVVMSAILSLVIYQPLRMLLVRVCVGDEAVRFWARFTIIMLFLSPLLVSVAFGVPTAAKVTTGALVQQILTTALFGSFLTMLGMGLWVSALIRRLPSPPIPAPARPL